MIFVLYEYVLFFHILMYFTPKTSFDMRIFSRGDRQREKESKTAEIV